MSKRKASSCILVLSDGTSFRGLAYGYQTTQPTIGELVFNTSLTGYQEILTDPSYAGQILCFTCPHIGNVGCNQFDYESEKVFAKGLVFRDASLVVSNFRAEYSLQEFLEKEKCPAIYDIDTRALVQHLRDHGSQMASFAIDCDETELLKLAKEAGSMQGKDYVKEVSCKQSYDFDESIWQAGAYQKSTLKPDAPLVVVIDCGVKRNILRLLVNSGFRVKVMPAGSSAEDIMKLNPSALFLSNGPGDPAVLDYVVNPVRDLLGKLPIFGICLGHQILAQALGGKTYKLKFGHRGGNHPVMDIKTEKVEITVQNHGFAVNADTVKEKAYISHLNLNDKTVEGIMAEDLKAFSVQYHPEASPGPHDSAYLFNRFYNLVTNS